MHIDISPTKPHIDNTIMIAMKITMKIALITTMLAVIMT